MRQMNLAASITVIRLALPICGNSADASCSRGGVNPLTCFLALRLEKKRNPGTRGPARQEGPNAAGQEARGSATEVLRVLMVRLRGKCKTFTRHLLVAARGRQSL